MQALEGKNTVVIGGTQGMGLATAAALVRRGARVLATGRSPGAIERARAELGAGALVVASDAASPAAIEALARTAEDALDGGIDALFFFAGVAEFQAFHEVDSASFERQFALNTRGCFFSVQRLLPLLRDGGAITLTTVTPATATPGMAVYMASKAAVRAFGQVLAAELLARRIRVNMLAPGFIDTPSLGVPGMDASAREALRAMGDAVTPMKRHGTVAEIVAAALYLAFDAGFTTGVELPVDGGLSTVDSPD